MNKVIGGKKAENLIRDTLGIFFRREKRGEGLHAWLPLDVILRDLQSRKDWQNLTVRDLIRCFYDLDLAATTERWQDGQDHSGFGREDLFRTILQNYGQREFPAGRNPLKADADE